MRYRMFTWAGIVLLGILLGCDDKGPAGPVDPTDLEFAPELGVNLEQMTKTASGLYYQDLVLGDGVEALPGSSVTVHYTGWLHDGTQFGSSLGGEPFTSSLDGLILGWQEGIPGMKVGGTRKLVVPPDLGYGSTGAGGGLIPPNATLVFEVQLLGVS